MDETTPEVSQEASQEAPKKPAREVLSDALRNRDDVPFMPLLRDYLRVRASLKETTDKQNNERNENVFNFCKMLTVSGVGKKPHLTRRQRYQARNAKRAAAKANASIETPTS